VKYRINDVICRDATTLLPISHRIAIASSTEMNAGHYLKDGGGTGEVMLVDWTYASQVR
jgi:hypothetical protein